MSELQIIASIKKQFENYKELGEKSFEQLSEEQLFIKINSESNSIATIVKHISGNMLSRWTNFLTTDGEKEWRNREEEFELEIKDQKELMERWDKGWQCLFQAISSISKDDLATIIFIRKQPLTVLEALHRQLTHYSYHIGQIVFIGKAFCNENWVSLSIPKRNK